MPEYKLTYFQFRGRAEPIRLIFKTANVPFQDIIVDRFREWPGVKNSTPLGNLPLLEIDGQVYPQSLAITRHLAKQFNLGGDNETEDLQCDVIAGTCDDLRIPHMGDAVGAVMLDAPNKEEAKNKLFEVCSSKYLPAMEQFLTDYGKNSGFFVGGKLTWADFMVYEILESCIMVIPNLLENFPKLMKHREMIKSVPSIKEYLETRPHRIV